MWPLKSDHKDKSHGSQWQIFLIMMMRTYPDEDQRTGVSHFVLPLRHLDHRKLSWTGTLTQNLTHLRRTKENQLNTHSRQIWHTHTHSTGDLTVLPSCTPGQFPAWVHVQSQISGPVCQPHNNSVLQSENEQSLWPECMRVDVLCIIILQTFLSKHPLGVS